MARPQSEKLKLWWSLNRERVNEHNKRWRRNNIHRVKDAELRRHYGITLDQYKILLKAQGGGCKVCHGPQQSGHKYFSVDHCHVTKTIRGLLCHNCNRLLGFARDSIAILNEAINYLERNMDKNVTSPQVVQDLNRGI